MTVAQFKLAEAAGLGLLAPVFFFLIHAVEGTRPFVTEFEAGAVVGVCLLKLIEAFRAYLTPQ
jgi:hypothetical protein